MSCTLDTIYELRHCFNDAKSARGHTLYICVCVRTVHESTYSICTANFNNLLSISNCFYYAGDEST